MEGIALLYTAQDRNCRMLGEGGDRGGVIAPRVRQEASAIFVLRQAHCGLRKQRGTCVFGNLRTHVKRSLAVDTHLDRRPPGLSTGERVSIAHGRVLQWTVTIGEGRRASAKCTVSNAKRGTCGRCMLPFSASQVNSIHIWLLPRKVSGCSRTRRQPKHPTTGLQSSIISTAVRACGA